MNSEIRTFIDLPVRSLQKLSNSLNYVRKAKLWLQVLVAMIVGVIAFTEYFIILFLVPGRIVQTMRGIKVSFSYTGYFHSMSIWWCNNSQNEENVLPNLKNQPYKKTAKTCRFGIWHR